LKKSVVHLIYSLDSGGAETVLQNLCYYSSSHLDNRIVVFKSSRVSQLKFPQKITIEKLNLKLILKLIKGDCHTTLMAWLFHSMLLSSVIKILNPKIKLIWNIRYSELPLKNLRTRLTFNLLKKLSFLPNQIIYNSHAGKKFHSQQGFNDNKSYVIQNGIDTNKFTPAPENNKIRNELNISKDTFVFGMVARQDTLKNHELFISHAIHWLKKYKHNSVLFLFIGRGMTDEYKEILFSKLNHHQYKKHFIFLGERNNLEEFYNAMDIHCLYSITEGFPNAVAESLACGTPNISTAVGDVPYLINQQTGWLISNFTFDEFESIFERSLKTKSDVLKQMRIAATEHIKLNFGLDKMITQYISIFN